MPIPANALPGDFLLVSFDGKDPNFSDVHAWLLNGGLIRIGQWLNGDGFAQYEHAAIYVGNGQIVEAQNTGTAIADAHRYDSLDTFWSTGIIDLTDAERSAIVAAAKGYVGTPYSWTDYFALAARRLHLWPANAMLENYVKSTKHMICSQVVAQCYSDAKHPLFNRWPGDVTPGDLYDLLVSLKR
jgi:cell wall-associated NlpC family hydrolase